MGWVYIMANLHNTVFYVGVTNDIARRVAEHKYHKIKGFTDKYNITKLIFAEEFESIEDAIQQEKIIKKWSRKKKLSLVNSINPNLEEITILI